jgi:hypothetical protein
MVKGSKEIIHALKDRLDEIGRDRLAEWKAFAADSKRLPVPTDSEKRLRELQSIHNAISREQTNLERQEEHSDEK